MAVKLTEFQAAISRFLSGQLDFPGLETILVRTLQSDPGSAGTSLQALDELFRASRLPAQIYIALKQHIPAEQIQPPAPPQQTPPAPPQQMPPAHQSGQIPQQPSGSAGHAQMPAAPQSPDILDIVQPGAPDPATPPSQEQPPLPPVTPSVQESTEGGAAPPPTSDSTPSTQGPSSDILEILQSGEPDPVGTQPPGLSPAAPGIMGTGAPAPHQTGQDEPLPSDDKTTFRQSAPPVGTPGQASVPHSGTGAPAPHQTGQDEPLPSDDKTMFRQSAPPTGTPGQSSVPHSGTGPAVQTGPTGGITGATGTGTGTGSSWTDPAKWGAGPAEVMQAGSILKDRYVLETVIGRGGMGVVFKAKDMRREEAQDRNPYIAVKILNDEFRRHPESLKALQRESRKAQNLAHPNIVTVFDFDRDGATVYMTMEVLEGQSLDRITKGAGFDGMPMSEAYPLIEGLGLALGYAHRKGIVHSDFKPANAFLTNDDVIKVFDFGIARAAKLPGDKSGEMTLFDPATLGALTPAYASCEMLDGEEPDARDDIYALACIAYELLTGKHPFDKRSAADARDKKLTPIYVKGLNRRQWRGLQRGLAFRREHRTPDVEAFLDELKARKINKATAAGSIAAAVVLIILAVLIVPSYLEERRVDNVTETIVASDDAGIPSALESLNQLEESAQDTVKGNSRVRTRLVNYYEAQIPRAWSNLDMPRAIALLDDALSLYPDSNRLDEEKGKLEPEMSNLAAVLNSRFNEHLDAGRLLPTNGDDIADVLRDYERNYPDEETRRRIKMHSPDAKESRERLAQALESIADAPIDARLATAYVNAANQALTANVGLAEQYIDELELRFPENLGLVDLKYRLNETLEGRVKERRVAELERQLFETVPSLSSLEAYRQIDNQISDLKSLEPSNQLVITYSAGLERLLDTGIDAALEENNWLSARTAVENHRRMLSQEYLTAAQSRIDAAESTYNEQVRGMLANVVNAVQRGELAQAEDYLNQLRQQGANPGTLREATKTVSSGYRKEAESERVEGRFENARALVKAGQTIDPDFSEWQQEVDAIDDAERLQAEGLAAGEVEKRLARSNELQKNIRANIALDDFGIESAKQTLEWIRELGRLDPSASQSTADRNEVAAKLATEAKAMGFQDNRWDEALELVAQGIELIPEENVLRQAREQLQTESNRNLAEIAVAEEETLQSDLDRLLGSPAFDSAWESDLRRIVQRLESLTSSADYMRTKKIEIARAYVRQAQTLITKTSFTRAEGMLKSAQRFVPEFGPAVEMRKNLVEARSAFNDKNREVQQQAQIDNLKETFNTELNAEEIIKARNALKQLRETLPAGDDFLANAPRAIADTYHRMASGALAVGVARGAEIALRLAPDHLDHDPETEYREAKERFDSADNLAKAGLSEVVDHTELIELLGNVGPARLEALNAYVAELEKIIQDAPIVDAERPKNMLDTIRRDAGTRYPEIEGTLRKLADKRVSAAGKNKEPVVAWISKIFVNYSLPEKKGPPCTENLAGYGGRARGRCFDYLPDSKTEGPRLVVVPAGSGVARPFAIARHEVSVSQWNAYCRISGNCEPRTVNNDQVPITNIELDQVLSYASWLSGNTKHVYRLPTDTEWVHAATADGSKKITPNCVNRQAGLMGDELFDVNYGSQNAWGIKNYTGNAQEWVIGPSGGYVALGGAYKDKLGICSIKLARPHAGKADELTGFRLLRELGGEA